jgi:hypothetical protein
VSRIQTRVSGCHYGAICCQCVTVCWRQADNSLARGRLRGSPLRYSRRGTNRHAWGFSRRKQTRMRLWQTQFLPDLGGDRSRSMESNLAQPGIYSARRKASILMCRSWRAPQRASSALSEQQRGLLFPLCEVFARDGTSATVPTTRRIYRNTATGRSVVPDSCWFQRSGSRIVFRSRS